MVWNCFFHGFDIFHGPIFGMNSSLMAAFSAGNPKASKPFGKKTFKPDILLYLA